MSGNIRSLNFDTLVERYVRLSPAVRYCQFICLAFGMIPLLLLFVVAFGTVIKLIDIAFALFDPSLTLGFDVTHYLIDGLNDRHQFGWLLPRTLLDALSLGTRAFLGLFVAICFVSLRLNLFAYGAILFLWIDWLL
jgi:hypothetical protein